MFRNILPTGFLLGKIFLRFTMIHFSFSFFQRENTGLAPG